MTNNNNAPFYVGQRVVCVRGIDLYKTGKKYTIGAVTQCNKCGLWQVGCVEHHKNKKRCIFSCGECGKLHQHIPDFYMVKASRFAPIEPRHQDVEIAEKIKEMAQEFATGTPEVSDKKKPKPAIAN